MAPHSLQLAGIGLAVLGVALSVAAVSTNGWLVQTGTIRGIEVEAAMGLFKTCSYLNGEELSCQSLVNTDAPSDTPTCSSDRTVGDDNAYVRAMQAMCILSILVGACAVAAAVAKATVLSIKVPVDAALSFAAAAVAFVTFVLFAVFYGAWAQCGTSMCDGSCDGVDDCTCGLNYSFALCVVSFAVFGIGGVLMALGAAKQRTMEAPGQSSSPQPDYLLRGSYDDSDKN